MFTESLLDSSPHRTPVLRARHVWMSSAATLAAPGAALFILPHAGLQPGPKALLAVCGVLAAGAFGTSLMLCYVYADARSLGLGALGWLAAVLVLNLVGFIAYLIYSAFQTGNWKRASLSLAYLFEGILGGLAVLVPLIYTQALPRTFLLVETLPMPPPAAGPPAAVPAKSRPAAHRPTSVDLSKLPVSIPRGIPHVVEPPLPEEAAQENWIGVPGGVNGGVPGGVPPGVLGRAPWGTEPPPPPQPRTAPTGPVRVGGHVQPPKAIYQPKPEYPPLAKMARIQGVVRLEAIIGKDGTIQHLRVLDGPPLLVKAALAAVERWRYQPTLLNEEPVDVLTEIDVNFSLND